MDYEGQLIRMYQQCAMEIKMENRNLGPLQIHHESMHRLIRHTSFIESEARARKKKNDAHSRNVNPIFAFDLFAPRRTNHKADVSKAVLPGRRGSIFTREQESDADEKSTMSKMWNPRRRQVCSDSNSMIGLTKSNGMYSPTVMMRDDLDRKRPTVHKATPGSPQDRLGKRRSSLFAVDNRRTSVDHDRCDGGACHIPRRSSTEVKLGASLICEFPAPGTLICDWGPRQSNDPSVGSLSSSEEWFCG
jgi:hypothetical protein